MTPEKIDPIIFDYLSDTLSPENKAKFEELKRNSPELDEYYKQVKAEWTGNIVHCKAFNISHAVAKFRLRTTAKLTKPSRLMPLLKIVASIAIIVSIGIIGYGVGYNSNPTGETTVVCGAGDKAQIMLPDGSTVNLNAQSSISYNNTFIVGTRNIQLVGEATFKVHADVDHPFTVRAQGLYITATGTEFNVMAYPNDDIVRTALVEGILNVSVNGQSTNMKANDVVSYLKSKDNLCQDENISAKKLTAWQNSEMVFENELLSQVVNQMGRYYNVDIILDPNIENKRFSGTVRHETIDELLIIFRNTLGIDVEKKNKIVYLKQSNNAS